MNLYSLYIGIYISPKRIWSERFSCGRAAARLRSERLQAVAARVGGVKGRNSCEERDQNLPWFQPMQGMNHSYRNYLFTQSTYPEGSASASPPPRKQSQGKTRKRAAVDPHKQRGAAASACPAPLCARGGLLSREAVKGPEDAGPCIHTHSVISIHLPMHAYIHTRI